MGENWYHERKIPQNPASQEKDQGKQLCKIKPDCLPLFFFFFGFVFVFIDILYIDIKSSSRSMSI